MGSVNAILTKRDGVTPLFDDASGAMPVVVHDPAGNPIGLGPVGPRKRTRGNVTPTTSIIKVPAGTKVVKVLSTILTHVGVGSSAIAPTSQRVRWTFTHGDPTSGNWQANFQGQTSANIPYNVTGANLVTALTGMSAIGAGGVTLISGGPLNTTPIVVEGAVGIIEGDQPLPTATTVDLAGGANAGSMLPIISESQAATNGTGFAEANSPFIFPLNATDQYLYLKGDDAALTGRFRITWMS